MEFYNQKLTFKELDRLSLSDKRVKAVAIEIRNEHHHQLNFEFLYIQNEKKYVLYVKNPSPSDDYCKVKNIGKESVDSVTLRKIKKEPWNIWWFWNWWRR
jgi:hypothetical protein